MRKITFLIAILPLFFVFSAKADLGRLQCEQADAVGDGDRESLPFNANNRGVALTLNAREQALMVSSPMNKALVAEARSAVKPKFDQATWVIITDILSGKSPLGVNRSTSDLSDSEGLFSVMIKVVGLNSASGRRGPSEVFDVIVKSKNNPSRILTYSYCNYVGSTTGDLN